MTLNGRQVPDKQFNYNQAGNGGSADITTVDTYLQQVYVNNTSGGALTITLSSKAGTPVDILTAKSVPANDFIGPIVFEPPVKLEAGMTLNAAAGLDVIINALVVE